MALFYVPALSSGYVLPEEESQHAVKVLRLQVGDALTVVDGTGGFYKARITNPHPKHCAFEVTETILEYGKRDYRLHIAIAPTKNIERLESVDKLILKPGLLELKFDFNLLYGMINGQYYSFKLKCTNLFSFLVERNNKILFFMIIRNVS